jgi:hypothetical protein
MNIPPSQEQSEVRLPLFSWNNHNRGQNPPPEMGIGMIDRRSPS